MLQFYITTSFCDDIDHFNAKCRKLLLYIFVLFVFVYCCCCCLHFANTTGRNVFCFFFSLSLYIFTSCVVTYPTVRKHHFRQHLIWNFHENHENHIPFFPIQIPEWVCRGDTENHYETCLWCAVDFNNLKFNSSSSVDAFEITCSCIFFQSRIRFVFNVFRIICTYNKRFFFHKYSLKCMALFFVITYDTVFFFFFHECSLKCTALFLDIHVVFNFNFLKDNETFKSVIKGTQLHTLSSLQIHILDEFDFGPNWTIRFIFPCPWESNFIVEKMLWTR